MTTVKPIVLFIKGFVKLCITSIYRVIEKQIDIFLNFLTFIEERINLKRYIKNITQKVRPIKPYLKNIQRNEFSILTLPLMRLPKPFPVRKLFTLIF